MPKKFTFRGGVHPPHCKSQTEHSRIEEFPAPEVAVIPLSQHLGAPAAALVEKGDRVLLGQVIGEPVGNVSATVHASVAGNVLAVRPFAHPSGRLVKAVQIENDGTDEAVPFEPVEGAWRDAARGELVNKIAECGIVGMGGAGFPTHVKLSPPSRKPIDTIIINGTECEPYLTDDHRIMIERAEDILTGAQILKKILGAKDVFFAIEDNKPEALNIIISKTVGSRYNDITVATLKSKYPQGGEKVLIMALTGRQVPAGGGLPMDVGCVVQNVSTVLAVFEAVTQGAPLYKRVVTVTGANVRSPKNLMVRIGTPARALLDACGADIRGAKKIVMGGPMMGMALSDLDVPIIKTTSALMSLTESTEAVRRYPCINCGVCSRVCPLRLIPSRMAKFVEKENFDDAVKWNLMECTECGTCAYACPAKINLVQFFRMGKNKVLANRAAEKKKAV
ncbi:MAG: electron transport complex subunit RsxC [Chitinispirillales bacterium]|nr:electron transport complex subunit RsxC [Chitinispirillales bacterium]